MTSRNLYDGVLVELHKENAPNILLEDFNYFANKAINQYINKRYNIYDINQQTTDDLRVLKATAVLTPHKVENTYDGLSLADMATYYVDLPTDYLHLLNCICIYNVKKTYKCYNAGDTWRAAATRLTADAYSQVLDNFWTKPSYKRPYYYIHNINISETIPTNPYNDGEGTDRDKIIDAYKPIKKWNNNTILGIISEYSDDLEDGGYYLYNNPALDVDDNIVSVNKSAASGNELSPYPVVEDENLIKRYFQVSTGEIYKLNKLENGSTYYYKWFIESFDLDRSGNIIVNNSDKDMFSSINLSDLGKVSNIERASQVRYGNSSRVRLEIRYGTDNSVFTLDDIPGKKGGKVYIDYIKSP